MEIIIGGFYKNLVNEKICRVSAVRDDEVTVHYFEFGIDLRYTSIENFMKYYEFLPEKTSYYDKEEIIEVGEFYQHNEENFQCTIVSIENDIVFYTKVFELGIFNCSMEDFKKNFHMWE